MAESFSASRKVMKSPMKRVPSSSRMTSPAPIGSPLLLPTPPTIADIQMTSLSG